MPTLKDDVAFGTKSEENIIVDLQDLFKTTFERQGGFSIMDYHNPTKTVYVELKTRRLRHDQYETTIVGKNKVDFCRDPNKDYYFVFSFLDGIYYIKYSSSVFSKFQVNNNYFRGERDDCKNVRQTVVYIPYTALTKYERSQLISAI